MRKIFTAFVAALALLAQAASAQCHGQNLINDMPAPELAALRATADAAPYATGNYWLATKGDLVVQLVGTYHMDDPRHADTLALLQPVLQEATRLLVEAGPEEMAALKKHMAKDTGLLIKTKGPTLPEALPPEVWDQLANAMAERGIPGFMAAKMQPWYLSMMLSIPTCALANMGEDKGLDSALMAAATARDLPIQALEPYDTIFGIFADLSEEDQMSMITQALALDAKSEDMAVTLADSYFNEEGRLIWEFMKHETAKLPGYTPERLALEFSTMEEAMVNRRNRTWIPVIEAAAAKGPVLVAFGALHLSGEAGVLNLLQQRGFTLQRLAFR